MGKPLWRFEGFITAAGNRVVQDWYWHEIGIDDREDIRDVVNYLANVERHLWQEPRFKSLGDIGELRKKTDHGALRVYGCFRDELYLFVFLNGELKKANKDRQGIETARLRMKKLNQKVGTTHEFDFEEESAGTNPQESAGQGAASGEQPIRGNCVPDSGNKG